MDDTKFSYHGNELDNFSIVINWKRYWSSMITPYLGKHVLEVGAGIGSSTEVICSMASTEVWHALEPDLENITILNHKKKIGDLPSYCTFQHGTIESLNQDAKFESILYIDVLEHIEDDQREISKAARHLKTGGFLIILGPAFPFLFSEFDRAIGHFRRYTKSMFTGRKGDNLRLVEARYLDSVGLVASLANRILLHTHLPSKRQLKTWDQYFVPCSRILDKVIGYQLGRSILIIYQKNRDDIIS